MTIYIYDYIYILYHICIYIYILVPMVRSYEAPDIQLPRIEPAPPGHGESEKSFRVEPDSEQSLLPGGSL